MMHKEMLKVLVCPMDRTPLAIAGDDLLEKINNDIAAGKIHNHGGRVVSEPLDAGLVRADGQFLYPIVDDIPVLLADEAIPLNPST